MKDDVYDKTTFEIDTSNTLNGLDMAPSSKAFIQAGEVSETYLSCKVLSKSCEVLLNITQIILDSRVTFFYQAVASLQAPPLIHSINNDINHTDRAIEQSHMWKRVETVSSSGRKVVLTQLTTRGAEWFRQIFTDFKLMDDVTLGKSGINSMQAFNRHMFALVMETNHEVCDNALNYLRNSYGKSLANIFWRSLILCIVFTCRANQ